MIRFLKQIFCHHEFEYVQTVFGYEGDIMLHQYRCKKCGRYDYLHPENDKDKDWNRGHGDGKLCNIFSQKYTFCD